MIKCIHNGAFPGNDPSRYKKSNTAPKIVNVKSNMASKIVKVAPCNDNKSNTEGDSQAEK